MPCGNQNMHRSQNICSKVWQKSSKAMEMWEGPGNPKHCISKLLFSEFCYGSSALLP